MMLVLLSVWGIAWLKKTEDVAVLLIFDPNILGPERMY